jgi:hypothetical protein
MNHKKSNTPELVRRFRRATQLIPGQPLKHSMSQEFNRIMRHALLVYDSQHRSAAIDYLSSRRPWLVEYCRNRDLPASGSILDALIEERKK